jgi:hypothetical protein
MSDEQEVIETEETPGGDADITAETDAVVEGADSSENAAEAGASDGEGDDAGEDDGVLELTGDEIVTFESKGVSETLCMVLSPRGWNRSFVEPFRVEDSELVSCGNPFSDAASGLIEISDGQID